MDVFPVMVSPWLREYGDVLKDCPRSLPWSIVAPHERQCQKNHGGQTLEGLANRGGLDPTELYAVLHDQPWREMPMEEAVEFLKGLVRSTDRVGK